MRSHAIELDEEFFVDLHSALRIHIELYHPTLQPVGIDLLIPRGVERVREIDALAVAADLDHLRTAIKCLARLVRVSCTAHNPAEMDRASLLRIDWIGNVI